MNRRAAFLGLVLISGTDGFSRAQGRAISCPASYEEAVAAFEAGVPPLPEDLDGWFTGRAYATWRHGPEPALFIGKTEGAAGAPLKLLIVGSSKRPEYYDETDIEEIREMEEPSFERRHARFRYTSPVFGSRGASFTAAYNYPHLYSYEARKSGDALVIKEIYPAGSKVLHCFHRRLGPAAEPGYLPRPGEP